MTEGPFFRLLQEPHLIKRNAYYWRNQNHEVDIVIDLKDHVIPLEVKNKNDIHSADIKAVLRFLENYQQNIGIIVTRNLLRERKTGDKMILCIPAWIFLLVV